MNFEKLRSKLTFIVAVPLILLVVVTLIFIEQFQSVLNQVERESQSRSFVAECYRLESKVIECFCDVTMNTDNSGQIDSSATQRELLNVERPVLQVVRRCRQQADKSVLGDQLLRTFLDGKRLLAWCVSQQAQGTHQWKKVNDEAAVRILNSSEQFMRAFNDIIRGEEQESSDTAALVQWHRIKSLLNFFAIASSALAISLMVAFTVSIRRPLKNIESTCDEISTSNVLTPLNSSSGDLDELHQLIYRLGSNLQKMLADEKAMITNARDLVCSLSASGVFMEANSYSFELLKIGAADLVGISVLDLCINEQAAEVDDALRRACSSHNPSFFDCTLQRRGGELVHTRWSCVYVDELLFAVIHDVTEERNVERLRADFVEMIGEDLQAPLASLHERLQNVIENSHAELSDDAMKEARSSARNAQRLKALIDDFVEMQSLESEQITLELAPFDMRKVVTDAVDILMNIIESKTLNVVVPKEPATIYGDGRRLTQVVLNLISNAIKFSPANGTITIEFESVSEEYFEFRVIDEGPGLPKEYRKDIFDAFVQAPGSKSAEGSGLGLAICRLIVEAHGGAIGVHDAEETGEPGETDETGEISEIGESDSDIKLIDVMNFKPSAVTGSPGAVFWFKIPFSRVSYE